MFGCDFCGKSLSEWDYMTECGHIICGYSCYNKYEESCPICKKKCKFTFIGEKVPKNGTGFLTSTRNIFDNAEKIVEFRFNALKNLIEYLRSKIAKQNKVLDQAKVELKQVKRYKMEIFELEQENEHLRQKIHQLNQMNQINQEYYHDYT